MPIIERYQTGEMVQGNLTDLGSITLALFFSIFSGAYLAQVLFGHFSTVGKKHPKYAPASYQYS